MVIGRYASEALARSSRLVRLWRGATVELQPDPRYPDHPWVAVSAPDAVCCVCAKRLPPRFAVLEDGRGACIACARKDKLNILTIEEPPDAK